MDKPTIALRIKALEAQIDNLLAQVEAVSAEIDTLLAALDEAI
jgi:prefoldin subunit 5